MGTLRVIDAASHQGNMNQSAMDFDALIVKATEGISYINPYCDGEFQEALSLGKKLGVYHFARNTKNSADAEANFFIQNTKGYVGKAIPVLDWEDSNTSDVAWALRWLQLVEQAYGCKPLIYMSESVVNSYNWSSVANADYGLWVAKYRDYIPDYNWNMASAGAKPSVKWWSTVALWQWTSVGRLNGFGGNLDCSIFYGDRATWDKYVGGSSAGWVKDATGWWYRNADGSYPKSCWKEIGGDWYYFDDRGYALSEQWFQDGGFWYYLKGDCRMAKGWIKLGDTWFYLRPTAATVPVGSMATGWLLIDGFWYFLSPEYRKDATLGGMLTGFFDDGDYTYYCRPIAENGKPEGSMVTGWLLKDGVWYYLNVDNNCQPVGSMFKNHWISQNGKRYYLTDDGKMAANTTLTISGDTFEFNASGEATEVEKTGSEEPEEA